jgi:hypothetical protein
MKIQLPVRWSERRNASSDEAYLKRLIRGEEDGEAVSPEEVQHIYGSVVLDVKDIRAYNDLDDDHCILRTYYNDSYCVALSLDVLKQVMVELTGENITIIKKQISDKPVAAKKPKPKKKDEKDENDLLI